MITEALMRPGAATIRLVENTPSSKIKDVFAAIDERSSGPGGHIVITPNHIDADAVGATGLLAAAKWTGRVTARTSRTEIECTGLASWLDSYNDAEISNTAGSISTWISALLINDLTAGTVTATGTSAVTRIFDPARQTRRQMLDTIATLGGWEYRINPDFTVDAATTANLFRTTASESTPLVVLTPVGGANEWIYRSLLCEIDDPKLDLSQISTKALVLGAGGYLGVDTAAVSLKTHAGGTPELVTTKVASTEPADNIDILAGLILGERTARWRAQARTFSPLARNHADPGDSIYVYDPLTEVVDGTNQIELRGETISPILTRVLEIQWPFERGMGLYLLTNAASSDCIDLTQWALDEGTTTFWVVGDADTPALAGRVSDGDIGIGTTPGGTTTPPPDDGPGGEVGFDCEVPAALLDTPYTTAIAFVPKACNGQVYEAVGGSIATKGPAFGQWIEVGDYIAIESGAQGVLAQGNAAALEYYGDATISVRASIGVDNEDQRLFSIAGLRIDAVGSDSDGWYPRLSATNYLGDEVTITSAAELDLDTAYDVFATFDASTGDVELFVDSSSVGTDALDNPGNRATQGDFWYIGAPSSSWVTNAAVWDEVVVPTSGPDDDGLIAWWDAADGDTVTTATGVSAWEDKAGVQSDLVQASTGAQPAYGSATYNGHPAITFDGTDDYLWNSLPFMDAAIQAGALTLFIVAKMTDTDQSDEMFLCEGRSTSTIPLVLLGNQQTPNRTRARFTHRSDGNSLNQTNWSTYDPFDGNLNLIRWEFDKATGDVSESVNGGARDTNTQTLTKTLTLDRLALGCLLRSSATEFFPADVCEIIAYNSILDSGAIAAVEAYLTAKWGI